MPSVYPHREKFRCQVVLPNGKRSGKVFDTEAEALEWGRRTEANIAGGHLLEVSRSRTIKTVADMLDWYLETDEAKAKKSERVDHSRAKTLKAHLGKIDPFALTSERLKVYKRDRMTVPVRRHGLESEKPRVASPATVQLELALLHRAYTYAVEELKWALPHGVPKLKRVKLENLRSRRVKPAELQALIANCHSFEAGVAFELAVETAMRRGELLGLDKERINLERRSVYLDETKTGYPRTVPLSRRAVELIASIMREGDTGPLFTIKPGSVLQALKRAAHRIGAEDIRFHDFRHEATSRLFEKGLNQIEVARITGHRTLEMLDRYTHLDVEHLVSKLD